MLWLKENTYFAQVDSGSFLLSYDALLRLDETVPRDVVDSVLPALREGQSFQQASAQLSPEQQAVATDLLGILQDHGLMVATAATRYSKPAPLPEAHARDQLFVVTGDGELSTNFAAALEQCGFNVRLVNPAHSGTASLTLEVLAVAGGDNTLLCHVAANDDGVCWSFADHRKQAPIAPPVAAFRRAASFGETPPPFDGPSVPIPRKTVTAIAANRIAHHILRPGRALPP